MGHRITGVRHEMDGHWTVDYVRDDGVGYAHSIPHDAVPNRMAAYGIGDPVEALISCIHEAHWSRIKPAPRDDPALILGYVTTQDPDSEPVDLYTARVGTDAAGARKARLDFAAAAMDLSDPDGLLPQDMPSPDRVRHHREMTDTYRWVHIYGDLPEPPRQPRPGIPLEAPRA